MLITLEFVITNNFIAFFKRILKQKRLIRIVIDECHIVLNDIEFQSITQFFNRLQLLEMFLFLLIAILSFIDMIRFIKQM